MGSRTRDSADKVFELFLEISHPEGEGKGPVILRKYPPDYDQQDVLTEIPRFAFPCKGDILQVEQFVFVLTDMEGMFRYVYCRHSTSSNTCLCIMSHLSWFDIFYKMLNFLADIVNSSEDCDPMAFLEATFLQDMPMPGVPVTIVAGQHMLSFTAPKPDQLPSIPNNRNLTEYYNAVDANNMMKIFASMLHERRIIITSKKLSRITASAHASEALLYPMHWQHLFIPVLPSHVIDMVTAPMPYLIGVHSSLMEVIETKRMDLGDAVIVDADKNEVRSEHDDLEALPDDVSSYLKRQLRTQRVQTSVMESGDAISRAFLLALVRLIGGYRDALKFVDDGPITFDRDAFVQSRTSRSTQAFLQSMLQLQIFQQFITGRLELLNDGKGFHDVFEQESIKYADHLNTQSKYKEWLAKKTRKLKITDLKDKAAPAVSTAVQSVNVQRKKVMSKLREFNENRMSTQKGKGEEINRRATLSTSKFYGIRPPSRPPPPSVSAFLDRSIRMSPRSIVYKTVTVEDKEEDNSHGHDPCHQSFSLVDVTMATDDNLKMTLTRSASVDDLFTKTTEEGDDSSISSSEFQAPLPEDVLAGSDIARSAVPQNGRPQQKRDGGIPDRLIPTDNPQDDAHVTPSRPSFKENHFTDKLISTDRLIAGSGPRIQSMEVPPLPTRRSGGGQSGDKASSSRPQPPPVPRPRKTSIKRDQVGRDESPPPPPLPSRKPHRPEQPLIRFESTEADTEFDPLMSQKTVPVEGHGAGPESGETASLVSLHVKPAASAAFQRSATYRRALENRPVYPDEPEDASTKSLLMEFDGPAAGSSSIDPLVEAFMTTVPPGGKQNGCSGHGQDKAVKVDGRADDPMAALCDLDPLASVLKASCLNPVTPRSIETSRGVHSQTMAEQSPSRRHDLPPTDHSAAGSGITVSGSNPSTVSTHPTDMRSAPLRPPPPLPRPRPRQSATATKSLPSTASSVSSSQKPSSAPPQRPSVFPKPSPSVFQQQDAKSGKDGTADRTGQQSGSHGASGALEDLIGLETSTFSNDATLGRSDTSTAASTQGGVRTPPKPMQRASVAALTKQFDTLKRDGGGLQSPSSFHCWSHPPESQPQQPGKQWETFD